MSAVTTACLTVSSDNSMTFCLEILTAILETKLYRVIQNDSSDLK
jgi:hypothetical protein